MSGFIDISADKAIALLASEAVTILDVRDLRSYRAGHIEGALLFHEGLEQALVTEGDYHKPILVYCFRGNESKKKAERLSELGFTRVYSLDNGFTGWPRRNPPAASATT